MAKWNRSAMAVSIVAGVAAFGVAGQVLSQDTPAPPPWQTLVHCAETGDSDDRLACYDAAMKAAGYAPKPEVVAAARRKLFGLKMPQINILKGGSKEASAAAPPGPASTGPAVASAPAPQQENEDNVTVQIARVATQGNGKLLFMTAEGQIWEQTDDVRVAPLPKEGASMAIHRTRFGGFFCDATRFKSVRCQRVR